MGNDDEVRKSRVARTRARPITDDDEEIQQRTTEPNCPNYCPRFECVLKGDCNMECEKLDMAKALICELCANPCETEKQKILMLNTKYYDQKKKEFSKNILDGVHKVKDRHNYLETRYNELKKEQLQTSMWKFWKKTEIAKKGKKIRYEMELIRQFMDWLEIPYKQEIDLDT